jgi:5'-deoxynucleotidase YfbR-like HD superfamily hydrolase
MKTVNSNALSDVFVLSDLLGEFGLIKRASLLPNGEPETDSHHSFSLALIAYEFACQYAPELDSNKILLYALVHDLPELVTGDVVTLTASTAQLIEKAKADRLALDETVQKLATAPHIIAALTKYENKIDDEAMFVYWIDKMVTIPTHFYDNGANLRTLGVHNRQDIQQWYERTLAKLQKQPREPHVSAVAALKLAYTKMYDELFEA